MNLRDACRASLLCLLVALPVWGDSGDERALPAKPEELVGQLMFVGIDGQVMSRETETLIREQKVGGILLFAHNFDYPEQVRRLNEAIRRAGGDLPPFIATDQEGGMVRRIRQGVPVVPSSMALGATRDPDLARRAGFEVGTALRRLGFTMNFAPVLDVLSYLHNDAIGTRSFSDDPELVAVLGAAYITGQITSGILPVAKHFPGQGGVASDTHDTLPILDRDLNQLRARELLPFVRAIDHHLPAVMTAHIAVPAITGRDTPASLSQPMLTGILRSELQFNGIVISDALQMKALDRSIGSGELAVCAILAGADMVIAVGRKERAEVYEALRIAARNGRIPPDRVRASISRIAAAKRNQVGVPNPPTEPRARLAEDIADAATTLIPAYTTVVPLSTAEQKAISFIGDAAIIEQTLAQKSETGSKLSAIVAVVDTEDQFQAARRLIATRPANTPLILVNTGHPRRILQCARCATILTYSNSPASLRAAAAVLVGRREARGTLPIRIPADNRRSKPDSP